MVPFEKIPRLRPHFFAEGGQLVVSKGNKIGKLVSLADGKNKIEWVGDYYEFLVRESACKI